MRLRLFLARLTRDERALAAVEYGFLCCLVVVIMVAALNGFANSIVGTWNNISTQVQTASNQASGG